MQRQLDTFNKLEELSNTLFGGFKHKGGSNSAVAVHEAAKKQAEPGKKSEPETGIPPEPSSPEVTAADSPGGQLLKSAETIFKGTLSAADSFIPHSVIGEYINKDLANEPLDQVAPNIANNIRESGIIVKAAVEDPRVRAALEAAIKVYGEAIGEAFDIAKPTIDELVDRFWVTIDNIGEKSARGATNAMIDTVSAAVAEIPMVGGLVDLFIAGGKWFNAVASGVIAPTVVSNGEVVGKGIYMGREGVALAEKYGTELEQVTSQLTSAVGSATQSMESARKGLSSSQGSPSTPPNSRRNSATNLSDQATAVKTAAMAKGMDMLDQAKKSKYGKAAMATGDYGMQLGKTGMRSAQLGDAVAKGNYLTAAKHSVGLGVDSAKLGYKGVKAARAVNKAKTPAKESKGGHNPFMIGGGSKASKKKARKTSKRLLRSIRRFTKKRR